MLFQLFKIFFCAFLWQKKILLFKIMKDMASKPHTDEVHRKQRVVKNPIKFILAFNELLKNASTLQSSPRANIIAFPPPWLKVNQRGQGV